MLINQTFERAGNTAFARITTAPQRSAALRLFHAQSDRIPSMGLMIVPTLLGVFAVHKVAGKKESHST